MAAPILPTLVPTGYSSTTGTAYTTTTVGNIDNGVGTPDGAFIVAGANSTASIFYDITNMPADFVKMLTLFYNIRYKIETLAGDTEVLYVRIFKSDKTTPLTDEATVVSTTANISITNKGSTALTLNAAGLAATKAEWDAAYLCIRTAHSASMGADGSVWSIDEVELTGTYEAPPTVALNYPADAATGISTTPQLRFTGTDPNASDTLEYEVQVDTVNSFNSTTGAFNLKYIDIYLSKNGLPTGNLTVSIFSGSITGTNLGTSNIVAESGVTTGFNRFTFTSAISLSANTKYYFRIARSNTDYSNYLNIYETSSDIYSGNSSWAKNASNVWNEFIANDVRFIIYNESAVAIITQNSGVTQANFFGDGGNPAEIGQEFTTLPDIPLLDKVSDVESPTHFLDYPDAGDTHPFDNATAVAYTVQSALANNTQYFWRVRAIDPSGSNIWGAWSSVWSFTTDVGTTTTTTTGTPTTTTTTTAGPTTTTTSTTLPPFIARIIIF